MNSAGDYSFALGKYVRSYENSYVFGSGSSISNYLENRIPNSFMIGFNSAPALFVTNKNVDYGTGGTLPPIQGMDFGTFANDYLSVPIFSRREARVGIGTTSPQSALHVLGAIKVSLLDNDNNYAITLLDVRGKAIVNDLKIASLTNSEPSVLTVLANGDVGQKTIASIKDDMGNHTATKDILTNGNWIRHTGVSGNNGLYINSTGNLGLGTSSLFEKIHVGDEFVISDRGNKMIGRNYKFDSGSTYKRIKAGVSSMISFSSAGDIMFYASASDVANSIIPSQSKLKVGADGNVCIGTENPIGYKLAVNGKIGCKGVVIENNSQWPDYVFADGYELRSLSEVEHFIDINGHLPEIPSESTVLAEGVDLGDMSALLLKKVEELTLYMIDQNKRIDAQQRTIEEQQKIIDSLLNK